MLPHALPPKEGDLTRLALLFSGKPTVVNTCATKTLFSPLKRFTLRILKGPLRIRQDTHRKAPGRSRTVRQQDEEEVDNKRPWLKQDQETKRGRIELHRLPSGWRAAPLRLESHSKQDSGSSDGTNGTATSLYNNNRPLKRKA